MFDPPRKRMPTKSHALEVLKGRGLKVDNVIDVGVFQDTVELRTAFPDSFHLLFEPLAHFAPVIEHNYRDVDHRLLIAAASATPGQGHLQLLRHNGPSAEVTHSQLLFQDPGPDAEGEILPIPIVRVDDTVKAEGLQGNMLLKIDVDGRDMDVLQGCEGILDQVDVVVIECLFLAWIDRASFLTDRGFRLVDVVDLLYYDDMFWQMDLVFISKRLAEQDAFHPYRGGGPDLSLFKGFY
jgi:FkbM family methyltransferase